MLKPCSECGKKVSTNAVACPHCGNQPKSSCHTCIEHCALDEMKNPICYSPHGSCPAYMYDDPSSYKRMKRLGRKIPD